MIPFCIERTFKVVNMEVGACLFLYHGVIKFGMEAPLRRGLDSKTSSAFSSLEALPSEATAALLYTCKTLWTMWRFHSNNSKCDSEISKQGQGMGFSILQGEVSKLYHDKGMDMGLGNEYNIFTQV